MGFWRNPIHERLDELEIDQAWQRRGRRKDAHPDAYELPSRGFWWKLFDELGNFVVTLIVVAAYVTSGFALIIVAFADRWALPIALAGFAPILGIPGLLLWRRWIDLSKTSQPRLMTWGIIALVGIASLAWLGFLIFVYVQKIDWYTGEPAIALPH